MLTMLVMCVMCGIGLALLLGKVFGRRIRVETYLPSPSPSNKRRYFVK